MCLQVIPWETWTWRTRVKSVRDQLADLERQTRQAQLELSMAQDDFESMSKIGKADEPLPKDYGKRLIGFTRQEGEEQCQTKEAEGSSLAESFAFTYQGKGSGPKSSP